MPRDPKALKICLLAGEASGDILGARLMESLRDKHPAIEFSGVGGALMEAQGMKSLFPMRDLSVMGIAEVLPRLPKILGRIEQGARHILSAQPDMVVTIDSPDFCFRVANKVRERAANVPKMVHYVAPTVWAWRPERAKKVAALYDGIICLYPFEPPYFEKENMEACFAGHPLMESGFESADGKALRDELGIPEGAPVLGLLFGSRMGELNRVGPALREAAEKYCATYPDLYIIAPTFPHLAREVKNLLQGLPCKRHVIDDQARKWDCFAAMDKALATSGTVGLELAVAGVPHIIAYKMSPLTWQIVKRKLTVKYAHLANILLDAPAVPEFIQRDCRADAIAAALDALDTKYQKAEFMRVRKMLVPNGTNTPSGTAAVFILDKLLPARLAAA